MKFFTVLKYFLQFKIFEQLASVVRILKFDNPICSEKFRWYPNPIQIRKFCSKHNPIQIRKSKTIIIPDSNHNNNFLPYLLNLVII